MIGRQALRTGALLWAMVGFAVAVPSAALVNSDARVFVGIASVALPACAALAAVAVARGRLRVAGMLLVLSAATPTYFAFALNLPALVIGIGLLVARRPGLKTGSLVATPSAGTS